MLVAQNLSCRKGTEIWAKSISDPVTTFLQTLETYPPKLKSCMRKTSMKCSIQSQMWHPSHARPEMAEREVLVNVQIERNVVIRFALSAGMEVNLLCLHGLRRLDGSGGKVVNSYHIHSIFVACRPNWKWIARWDDGKKHRYIFMSYGRI